jgi:hypothetical protein
MIRSRTGGDSRYLFGRSQGANCSSWPAAGARATLPHKPTHKPSVRNRGRVAAGGGSWLDGANFPETPLSVSKKVFGPEHYFGARKGSAAARSISQAVVEPAVRLPAPADVTNGCGSDRDGRFGGICLSCRQFDGDEASQQPTC